ncbi:MAG: CADD family putative folate metabolism protein [Dehalococcoidia bacterium]|nr:CADD family putative folate metabolism protein [Dehalococcoidia bacterium]
MTSTLFGPIDAVLDEKSMLKHPFYQDWNEGKLSREALKQYACQYHHFVSGFARVISAVHSNTPDPVVRQELLESLREEEEGPENHPALWRRFARALGATDEEIASTVPLPTTAALVSTMQDDARNGSFQEGIATIYAYESQVPGVSRTKIDGLARFYDISDEKDIEFFTVHEEIDTRHAKSERELLASITTPDMESRVQQAASRTANALWGFLDGVHENYVVKSAA